MKTTTAMFILILLVFTGFSQELSKNAWLEDLAAYKSGLEEKHIDVYNKISQAEFEADLEKIKTEVGEKTDFETVIELMQLTRKIGDGHTAVSFQNLANHNLPLEIQNFDRDWRVVKVAKESKHLLGQILVEINGHPIDEVANKVSEVAQFVENPQSQRVRTAQYLAFTELLWGLGITNEKASALLTFQDETGKTSTEKMNGLTKEDYKIQSFSVIEIGVPEITPPENDSSDEFWYSPIAGTNGLYIHFESYPSFEEMMSLGEEIVNFIFQNNIQSLVVDMRNNGGGDLYTGLVLAYALNLADPIDWKSGVYVLSDQVTFSAATSNTALFRELLNAKIVGEATGSNPTGYQDMDTFELPNSKLVICYSKRLFRIQEKASAGVQPDISMKYDWKSFSQGKDNMLEWVISDMKKK